MGSHFDPDDKLTPGEKFVVHGLLSCGTLQDPTLHHRGPVEVGIRDEDDARTRHRGGRGIHQSLHLKVFIKQFFDLGLSLWQDLLFIKI